MPHERVIMYDIIKYVKDGLILLKDYIWYKPKMAPSNEHRHFPVIVYFVGTDIHRKFFQNFHFDLIAHNLRILDDNPRKRGI